jgi:hypothetical protein
MKYNQDIDTTPTTGLQKTKIYTLSLNYLLPISIMLILAMFPLREWLSTNSRDFWIIEAVIELGPLMATAVFYFLLNLIVKRAIRTRDLWLLALLVGLIYIVLRGILPVVNCTELLFYCLGYQVRFLLFFIPLVLLVSTLIAFLGWYGIRLRKKIDLYSHVL